jgi:hypothetical protein
MNYTYIGISLIHSQVGYAFLLMFYSYINIESKLGCAIHYPSFMLWYWVAVNIPFNVVFSNIFCYVAYKQHQHFGSDSWGYA